MPQRRTPFNSEPHTRTPVVPAPALPQPLMSVAAGNVVVIGQSETQLHPAPRLDARIPAERLEEAAAVLFGEQRIAGPLLALQMGVPHVTLWLWLNRRDMPDAKADQLAGLIDAHAHRLLRVAGTLRSEANHARMTLDARHSQ